MGAFFARARRWFTPSAAPSESRRSRIDHGALIVFALVSAAMGVLLLRVVQLQVKPPAALAALLSERTSKVREPGLRGDIVDRAGRVLAATRFGYRAYVDPVEFAKNKDVDAAIAQIAQVLGLSPSEVGKKILAKVAANEAKVYDAQFYSPAPGSPEARNGPSLARFVGLGGVLDDSTVDTVRRLKIKGLALEQRPVREIVGDDLCAVIVGKVGSDGLGLIAAERMYEQDVKPTDGAFRFVRDARGRPLWVEPDGYTPPTPGRDVRLSIDLELQRILTEELQLGIDDVDAEGGRAVLMDPHTGEVLAIVDLIRNVHGLVEYDWEHVIPKDKSGSQGPRYRVVAPDPPRQIDPVLGRNRCVVDLYEPGSTFKAFMWAAATDLRVASPDERIEVNYGRWTTPYGRPVSDVGKNDAWLTWQNVLVKSSNVGMVKVCMRLTAEQMRAAVRAFGFGEPTGLGFKSESPGLVTPLSRWSKYTHTSVSFGHEVAVTPIQMVRAFSAFARLGEDAGTIPSVHLLAVDPQQPEPVIRRAVSAATANLVRDTLLGVTHNLDQNMERRKLTPEGGWRYVLFGKSGTPDAMMGEAPTGKKRPKGSTGYYKGQFSPTFIAGGPYENPRLVCVVVIDDPSPNAFAHKQHYGAMAAGPVVRRTMERALSYLGVPASPPIEGDVGAHTE